MFLPFCNLREPWKEKKIQVQRQYIAVLKNLHEHGQPLQLVLYRR